MLATRLDGVPGPRRICTNCGRLGHLARSCERPTRSYDRIGVEVEGFWKRTGWDEFRRKLRDSGLSSASDGSLVADDPEYLGYEIRTTPGHLGEVITQVSEWYPQGTNNTAGMHVHVSFRDHLSVTALYSMEFFEFFRARWHAWGTQHAINEDSQFWVRLRGANNYCRLNTAEDLRDDQIDDGDRYRQLNFTSWGTHKTVECRLLPMFRDLRLAISAVEELVAIYEDYLAQDRLGGDVTADVPVLVPLTEHSVLEVHPERAAQAGTALVSVPEPHVPPRVPGHERYCGNAEQVLARHSMRLQELMLRGAQCA